MNPPTTPDVSEPLLRSEEIGQLSSDTEGPAECLSALVRLLQARLQVDVCSTYLLEPDRSTLVLAATVGLNPKSVGRVRMKLHEGLTGMVAENMTPMAVEDADQHRRYKYFPEAGEELFHSFLGIPLIDRGQLQGVLTVQTSEPRSFREDDVRALEATAKQLAPVISQARTLKQFITPTQQRLWALARNLWWCWDSESVSLFRDLDPVRWRESRTIPSHCCQSCRWIDWKSVRINWSCIAASATPIGGLRSMFARKRHGARLTRAYCGRAPWRISPPSLACMNRCQSIPEVWASWPAIT